MGHRSARLEEINWETLPRHERSGLIESSPGQMLKSTGYARGRQKRNLREKRLERVVRMVRRKQGVDKGGSQKKIQEQKWTF